MRALRSPAGPLAARALGALAATLALTLTATGCSNDAADSPPKVSTTEHNAADVAFASDMIQHHAQALAMVDLAAQRPLRPEVQELTEAIRDAQGPEIETMSDWLTDWDEDVPETIRDHANAGHDMGDMEGTDGDMPGMMTADDLSELEAASDADFEAMWLEMMVEHHEGAVEMAEVEQSEGQFAGARDLADDIVDSQTAEIATMEDLLGS